MTMFRPVMPHEGGCGECQWSKWQGYYAVDGGECRLDPPPYRLIGADDWCSHFKLIPESYREREEISSVQP